MKKHNASRVPSWALGDVWIDVMASGHVSVRGKGAIPNFAANDLDSIDRARERFAECQRVMRARRAEART
jgi:hypothetical protein